MRRLAIAVAALALAFSPVALQGLTRGIPSAHADLGWCDTCAITGVGGGPALPPPAHAPHH